LKEGEKREEARDRKTDTDERKKPRVWQLQKNKEAGKLL